MRIVTVTLRYGRRYTVLLLAGCAIMTAVIALVNFLVILICQPWMINPPGEEISFYVLDPSELEFAIDENESGIPLKDTILAFCLVCLLFVARRQLAEMDQETEEIKNIIEIIDSDHKNIMEIKEFRKATEESFDVLQTKSKVVSTRMNKARKISQRKSGIEKIQEDLDFVKDSWFQQYSTFSMIGISQDLEDNADAQLEGVTEGFYQELSTVEKHIDEDKLALDDVIKDIHVLQNYFGMKTETGGK